MSRMARFLKDGGCYLIESQASRGQKIFKMDSDYEHYLRLSRKYKLRHNVDIYAYCLIPSGAYLVVHPKDSRALPSFMQGINQSYALYFNQKYHGWGKVWGQRYKSTIVESNSDLQASIKSVEFIPVERGYAVSPTEYTWSSCTKRIFGSKDIIDQIPEPILDINSIEGIAC